MNVDQDKLKVDYAGLKRAAWLEVNLAAIRHNLRALRELIGARVKIMAVVKANGYGHGIIELAKTAISNGAEQLGVAMLQEASELRKAGMTCPILVLGGSLPQMAPDIVCNEITQAVSSIEMCKALSQAACSLNRAAYVHIKIDTGMGRLGIDAHKTVEFVKELQRLPGLVISGVFTHLACADEDNDSFSRLQLENFQRALRDLASCGIHTGIVHAANSAAILKYPEAHFDMIRPGLALYGLPPYPAASNRISLRPSLSLKARIVQVKDFPRGSAIGYGRTYTLQKDTVLAVVPVGYADGLPRALSNKGYVVVRANKAPIVGRVCMDQFTIDIGHIPHVEPGEIVTIIGESKKERISARDVADAAGTIQNEVVSSLTDRLPRLYIDE
jgi:alanine racemase